MKIYDIVLKILQEKIACRSSDKHLIWTYMTWKAHKSGSMIITMQDFLNCTPFETITRARRKVQEHHPELRGTEIVTKLREKKQQEFPKFLFK